MFNITLLNTLALTEEGQNCRRKTEVQEFIIMNDFTIRSSSNILHLGIRVR